MDELLAAVADCDTETIADCLDAGADLHHVGLIHEAVSTDDMQVVTLLLGRGAQVNQRDANGRTPLHCAQSRGVSMYVGSSVGTCSSLPCSMRGLPSRTTTVLSPCVSEYTRPIASRKVFVAP